MACVGWGDVDAPRCAGADGDVNSLEGCAKDLASGDATVRPQKIILRSLCFGTRIQWPGARVPALPNLYIYDACTSI